MPILIPILLKYSLPGILISVLLCLGIGKVYNSGKDAGRLQAESEHHSLEVKRQEAIRHVAEQVEVRNNENRELVASVANKQLEDILNINSVADDLRQRGLYQSAKASSRSDCDVRREAGNTSITSGGADRERLSSTTEEFYIARFKAADQVVAQYNNCRALLKELTIQKD